ncbi:hypothetical protein B9Z55_009046 [Caenorhabditis nigoni]|uniref:F-box domain-containing protein n=1 Tax=Caenorhabditis nigoni TaxID=1611254 RepID=A0A2G5UQE1_9PELO|nr:hypothetical protein B9Z55_009046 [Caenorhabditis nigoni]
MQLSKFPYLVQKEMFDNMRFSSLFLLSFVSKNTKNLIKSSQTTRFKSIPRIVYSYDNNGKGTVYISATPDFPYDRIHGWKRRETEDIIKTVELVDAKIGSFHLNVAGKLIDFQIRNFDYCPVASFLSIDKESVMESIHNYFLGFIGDSVEYHWISKDCKRSISQLQNLSACLSVLCIDNGLDDMKNLEAIFSSSPFLKHIDNQVIMKEAFSPDSKFYHAESIEMKLNEKTLLAVLQHFQGRQAYLKCSSSIEIRCLTEFVNRWKSGEAFQNLEYLKVQIPYGTEFPRTQILNAFGLKRIDSTKTPPTHTLPKVCSWYYFYPDTDPITSHTYVVRRTDNRVASISVRGYEFSFGVWNKSEEEFLAMVK